MKKYLLILLSLIIIPLGMNAMNMNNDRDISKLWEQYEKAEEADKPKDQLKILAEIKTQAAAHRLTADFYRAVTLYEEVTIDTDWKQRDKAGRLKSKEIADYDEPILTFLLCEDGEDALALVRKEGGRLKAAANKELWEKQNEFIYNNSELVLASLDSDYDFVVWSLFYDYYGYNYVLSGKDRQFVNDELAKIVSGKYPQEALYEFMLIERQSDGRTAALEAFAKKYEDKAVSLWAKQRLLREEFNAFEEDKTTSEQYGAFYRKLEKFEDRRASFKGDEAKIADKCLEVKRLMSSMKGKEAQVSMNDGRVTVLLRNLADCDFILYKGKIGGQGEAVYTRSLNEDSKTFYAWDKVEFELPVLDDGEYNIEVKKGKKNYSVVNFPKYTLSVAFRNNAVYVADYKSGKPVEKVDMHLVSGESETDVLKDFAIDGFTALPDAWLGKLNGTDRRHRLYVSSNDGVGRRSPELSYFPVSDYGSEVRRSISAVILKDCAAFNPGQTVKFKTVVYASYTDGRMEVLPEGTAVNAELVSPDNKTLKTLKLEINEFGAANGEFELSGLKKYGRHSIAVSTAGGERLASSHFVVDEYVLPSFSLSFDSDERMYLPGDEVEVSGVLKSYSGHSLSGATVTYTVDVAGEKSSAKPLEVAADGRFSLHFNASNSRGDDYLHCIVTVKVVDATGETLEFGDYRTVASRLNVVAQFENSVKAEISLAGNGGAAVLVEGDAKVKISAQDVRRLKVPVDVKYTLQKGEKELQSGVASSGDVVEFALAQQPEGLYTLKLYAETKDRNGRLVKAEKSVQIMKMSKTASETDVELDSYFRTLDGISVQFSAGRKDAWLVAELFDDKAHSLKKELIHIPAAGNGKSKVRTLSYDYEASYPDAVVLDLFYFRDGRRYDFSHTVKRPALKHEIPLSITRFTDSCLPGANYSVVFKSTGNAEFAASVFDLATETIAANDWPEVYRRESPVARAYVSVACGEYGYDYRPIYIRGMARTMSKSAVAETSSMADALYGSVAGLANDVIPDVEEEEMLVDVAGASVAVRENFATSLAFEPHLRAADNGKFSFDFTTSDKLSTFVCALYGHDKEMNTVTERKEFVVTMPVKVSAVQPQFLYEGDSYVFKAAVTNSGKPVKGVFTIYMYKGDSDEVSQTASAGIELGENATEQLSLPVSGVPAGLGSLSFKAVFEGAVGNEKFSDAIRVSVPVLPARQILTEAHSAVLLNETERETLMDSLRSAFVNTTAAGARFTEASLDDLLRAELKVTQAPEYQNALSLMDALYCNVLGGALVSDNSGYKAAAEKIEAMLREYVNSDGGFAWMKGMKSSVVISSCIAERIAFLRERGLASDNLLALAKNAVKFIDRNQFEYKDLPYWCGYLSDWQYMLVRSLWTEVPFDRSIVSGKVQKENFEKFTDWASDLLVGKKRNGINGNLGAKYTRMYMLLSLLTNENGRDLAKTWGIRFGSESKLLKALAADVQSLNQYAVEHRSGAWYLPDLVMPYRGVLMSEAFHHANVANLYYALANVRDEAMAKKISKAVGAGDMAMAAEIADGIRLWIMIQKESQEWRADAEFYTAIASVYDGSETLKAVKIISLNKKYEKPFEEIKAAGNGFGIEVKYYLDEVKPENEIKAGRVLKLGDKVVAQYNIWNEENRSFVRLSVPRPACLRPEEQVSGYPRWTFYRIGCLGFWFTPMAYREVRARYTDYWFDVLPEEKTVYTENFYVTQAGVFTLPVASVESLYAPHYRANDAFRSRFVTE